MLWPFCNPNEKKSKTIGWRFFSLETVTVPEELKSITRNTVPFSFNMSIISESSIWINPCDDEISPASTIVIELVPSVPKERENEVSLKSDKSKSF